jgi:plasmid stability protein
VPIAEIDPGLRREDKGLEIIAKAQSVCPNSPDPSKPRGSGLHPRRPGRILAGWFGHLDINITLAKSYLAWCEDNMGVIVIRNLSLETHRALQARAARHNRSTEAEARMILDEAVRPKERVKLGSALAAFGRSVGGLDLDISRDPTSAKPIDLG